MELELTIEASLRKLRIGTEILTAIPRRPFRPYLVFQGSVAVYDTPHMWPGQSLSRTRPGHYIVVGGTAKREPRAKQRHHGGSDFPPMVPGPMFEKNQCITKGEEKPGGCFLWTDFDGTGVCLLLPHFHLPLA